MALFEPLDDHLLLLREGGLVALLPSSGLFHAPCGPPPPGLLVATRSAALPVELAPAEPQRRVWVDVRRLAAMLPAIWCELRQQVGADDAERLLSGAAFVRRGDDVSDIVVTNPPERFLMPAGWLDGDGLPEALPHRDELPAPVQLRLRLPAVDVLFEAAADEVLAQAHAVRAAVGAALLPERAALDVQVLDRTGDAHARLARRRNRADQPPWRAEELRRVLTTVHALVLRPGADPLSWLTAAFGETGTRVEVADEGRALLPQVCRLWGRLARQAGRSAQALAFLDAALAAAADPDTRRELRHERAHVRLTATTGRHDATGRGAAPPPEYEAAPGAPGALDPEQEPGFEAFPVPAPARVVRVWEHCRAEQAAVVAADPGHRLAWLDRGLACLLLACGARRLPLRTRRRRTAEALAAYEQAAGLAPTGDVRAVAEAGAATARRAAEALDRLPWWRRAVGRRFRLRGSP
jgi:hypothetical protein